MVWFKVDDGFHSHHKTITAGTAAIGLWTRCGSWSEYHLTDGFIPRAVALSFGSPAMIGALLKSGLWHEIEGGYQFHDFGDYNPLADDVRAEREAAKERQRHARERAKSRKSSPEVTRDNVVTSPKFSPPVPDPVPEGSKEPLAPRKRLAPRDFSPPSSLLDWADEHARNVDLPFETSKMIDWSHSKNEKRVDWNAAWRNWMRTAQQDLERRAPQQQLQRRSDIDKMFG